VIKNEPLTSRLEWLRCPSMHRHAALGTFATLLVCGSFDCAGTGGCGRPPV